MSEVNYSPSSGSLDLDEGDVESNATKTNISGACYNFDNSPPSIASQLLMSAVILFLNFMVVTIIFNSPKKSYRKPAFIFIIALAATDMLLAIILVCFSVVSIGDYQLSTTKWVMLTASSSVCFNASVNFLLVIAVDRLCFIGYNRKYRKIMTRRNIGLLIALCWVVGFIPVLPLFLGGVGSCAEFCYCFKGQNLICPHPTCSTVLTGFTKNFLFGLFFYFLLMLISISFIYGVLFYKVRHHANRVRNHSNEPSSRSRSSRMCREFKLARTLGIVVMAFFICWSPLMLLYIIDFSSNDDFKIDQIVALAVMSPAVLNSMLNPIIYAARIPMIRKYLCRCTSRQDDTRNEHTGKRNVYQAGKSVKSLSRRNAIAKNTSTSATTVHNERRMSSCKKESHTSYSTHLTSTSSENTNGDERSRNRRNTSVWFIRIFRSIVRRFRSDNAAICELQSTVNDTQNNNVDGRKVYETKRPQFSPINEDISISQSVRNSIITMVDNIILEEQSNNREGGLLMAESD